MCIILLAHQVHAELPLIFAANRDEFYERATAQARFWTDAPCVLAGRDLERGGTWLGVNKRGRIAAVTNYREPGEKTENAPSRGLLVSRFLEGHDSPQKYLSELSAEAHRYKGFNLIVGDARRLYYYSNRLDEPQELTPGVHGLSNHLLDTPWPKVERGKQALEEMIEQGGEPHAEAIFKILADDARAVDEFLPQTGVGLELERVLSPLFINTAIYGTRSSTVILFDRRNRITFIERTFSPEGSEHAEARYQFKIRSER